MLSGFLAAAVMFPISESSAQSSDDELDFSLPGARSLAMGGAFTALADDATSAYSNPAGLVRMSRPELAIEFRAWGLTTEEPDRGHGFGPPSGIGIDTVPGISTAQFDSNSNGVSFLSAVYPRGNWAVGIFRHEFPSFRIRKEVQGPFFDCAGGFREDDPQTPGFCDEIARLDGIDRIFPNRWDTKLSVSNFGAGGAYRLGRALSFGVSLLRYSFELDATNTVFGARGESKFITNFSDPDNVELVARQTGEDSSLAVNVGGLWTPNESLTLGASYRQGAEFTFAVEVDRGPAHPHGPGPGVGEEQNPFRLPDTYTAGIGYRILPELIVTFQYDFVEFSVRQEGLKQTSAARDSEEARAIEEGLRVPDAHRFRLGAEYSLLMSGGTLLSFRAGAWYDTAHEQEFRHDPATGLPAPRVAVGITGSEAVTHFTAGAGVALQPHIQIDAAIDYSAQRKTLSASALWRF